MRALIVDDEAPARAKLRRMLMACEGVEVVGEAAGGREALALCERLRPDLVLLDVQMPEVGGLDVAASLPDDGPAVVFVTAHAQHAVAAFDTRAHDYLLKPVEPERLARALQRVRADRAMVAAPRTAPPAPQRLLITDRGTVHAVAVAEVEWLGAADNYVEVHLADRSLLLRRSLAALLHDLGEDFVRVHRSAAVAVAWVQAVRLRDKGDATVVMHSGAEVPCSRPYRAALQQRLASMAAGR